MLVTSGPKVSFSVKGNLARVAEQGEGRRTWCWNNCWHLRVNPDFRRLGSSQFKSLKNRSLKHKKVTEWPTKFSHSIILWLLSVILNNKKYSTLSTEHTVPATYIFLGIQTITELLFLFHVLLLNKCWLSALNLLRAYHDQFHITQPMIYYTNRDNIKLICNAATEQKYTKVM